MRREKLITVFETKKTAVLTVAKSLLDDVGIHYQIKSEYLGGTESTPPFEIQVFNDDEKTAKRILINLDKAEDRIDHPKGHPHTKSQQYYSSMTFAVLSVICVIILLTVLLIRC